MLREKDEKVKVFLNYATMPISSYSMGSWPCNYHLATAARMPRIMPRRRDAQLVVSCRRVLFLAVRYVFKPLRCSGPLRTTTLELVALDIG